MSDTDSKITIESATSPGVACSFFCTFDQATASGCMTCG